MAAEGRMKVSVQCNEAVDLDAMVRVRASETRLSEAEVDRGRCSCRKSSRYLSPRYTARLKDI